MADDSVSDGWLVEFWERRGDLLTTVLLAAATVLTAWAGYQSAKWSGVQAIAFSEAGANRTESTRASTTAGQQSAIDVTLFTSWLDAAQDVADEPEFQGDDEISPALVRRITVEGTLAAFLFQRFRDEFKSAVEAWLVTDPFDSPDAPPTRSPWRNTNSRRRQRRTNSGWPPMAGRPTPGITTSSRTTT